MKKTVLYLACFCICLLATPVSVLAAMHTLVVVGLGGGQEYRERFESAAGRIAEAMQPSPDVPGSFTLLQGSDAARDGILEQIKVIGVQLQAQDQFTLMLLGHGSYDGESYRFNVAGPDITGVHLRDALQSVKARRQLVVIASSASGAVAADLQQPDRVLITATKNGGEINAVYFPEYWADALSLDLADVDHNELLSVREAFDYAEARVRDHYENEGLMATEHARIYDETGVDLVLSRLGSLKGQDSNPVVNQLLQQRTVLEQEFYAVLSLKSELPRTEYLAILESVLLRIARLQQNIDEATGWSKRNG